MFPGQAERVLPRDGYRRSLFWRISAGALISDTLQAAISFEESPFPNISTAWLRDDNAMEIPVSRFGTLLMPLHRRSLRFLQWSKIFWLRLSPGASRLQHEWAGCRVTLRERRRCLTRCRSAVGLAVSPSSQPVSLSTFSVGKTGAGPELRASSAWLLGEGGPKQW